MVTNRLKGGLYQMTCLFLFLRFSLLLWASSFVWLGSGYWQLEDSSLFRRACSFSSVDWLNIFKMYWNWSKNISTNQNVHKLILKCPSWSKLLPFPSATHSVLIKRKLFNFSLNKHSNQLRRTAWCVWVVSGLRTSVYVNRYMLCTTWILNQHSFNNWISIWLTSYSANE